MELYLKDELGMVHVIEEGFEHLLAKNFPRAVFTQITKEEADALAATPAPTQEQIIAQYEAALDAHLDSVANTHRFKDRHSLALRAGYPSAYHDLGLAFAQWMDDCNVKAYGILQAVLDGQRTLPTIPEFIAELPPFVA